MENIAVYPDLGTIRAEIEKQPGSRIIDAKNLAKEAGSLKAVNIVMIGAVSASIPISNDNFLAAIDERFASKGESVQAANRKAYELSRGETANA